MKSRVVWLDAATNVAGVFVIILIASAAFGRSWTVQVGSFFVEWPNRSRHGLFLALGLVIVARVIRLRASGETSGAAHLPLPSRSPNGWLLGTIAGLLLGAISAQAFEVPYPLNDIYHEWARKAFENPRTLPALIVVPRIDSVWGHGYFRPLPTLTYLADLIWDAAPAGVVSLNLVLFSVLAVKVGLLAQRFTQDWRIGGIYLTQLAPTHCGPETQPTLRRAHAQ